MFENLDRLEDVAAHATRDTGRHQFNQPRKESRHVTRFPTYNRLRPLRQVHRSLQAHPLGHRSRRDPRPAVRLRQEFLPDGLSKVAQLPFLNADEQRLFSQVQGRTYANIFALVERFIGAKVLEISRGHWLGDQVALEALVRLTDEELKHQEMFRRLETMMAPGMPAGYRFLPQPNDVAQAVLAASTWAVLALTCDIELFSQAHYRSSIDPETQIDPLWKDVFLFHWKEESQHAILDEMEWMREDKRLDARSATRPLVS